MRIAIVGGGISGLSTAFYVKQHRPDSEATVLERNPRLGGGPWALKKSKDSASNKPDTLDLVKAVDGGHLLMASNDAARLRYIYKEGVHALPDSPPAFLSTKLLSWHGKLRTMRYLHIAQERKTPRPSPLDLLDFPEPARR